MTWNVLHRVHAENYLEPVLAQWPHEPHRVGAIAQFIVEALTTRRVEVVLLQEASGDVLKALSANLGPGYELYAHELPRVPRFKRQTSSGAVDVREHVAVVAPRGGRVVAAGTSADDLGKGYVGVELPGGTLTVFSTHVSWGPRQPAQLAKLRDVAAGLTGPVVIGGDFNAEKEHVVAGLGDEFVVTSLGPNSLPTRPSRNEAGQVIDHLLARGASWVEVEVIDEQRLSDHLPVAARLAFTP